MAEDSIAEVPEAKRKNGNACAAMPEKWHRSFNSVGSFWVVLHTGNAAAFPRL
jgi:hypothetical protein